MAKGQFHIGKSGTAPCDATVQECRLGGGHFDTEVEAEAAYQKILKSEFDVIPTMTKEERKARREAKRSARAARLTAAKESGNDKGLTVKDKLARKLDKSLTFLEKNPTMAKAAAVTTLVALIAGGAAIAQNSTEAEQTCTVTDKSIILTIDKDKNNQQTETHVVQTDECGTLELGGGITHFTTNAKELYSSMKVGQTYKIKTTGIDTWMTNKQAYEATSIGH